MSKESKSIKEALASSILYESATGKTEEIKILHGFLERLGFVDYTPRDTTESPDFFIDFSYQDLQATIAIELTFFYNTLGQENRNFGASEKRFIEQWKRIARRLRQELDKIGGDMKYVYGSLSFQNPGPYALDPVGHDDLIAELLKVTQKNLNKSERITTIEFPNPDYPTLSSSLKSVALSVWDEEGILWWCSHIQSGTVNDPNDAILRIIRNKNQTAQSYQWNNVNERWLVIYAASEMLSDMAIIAGDFDVSREIPNIEFTRIILWSKFTESITELFPRFQAICDPSKGTRNVECYPLEIQPFVMAGKKYTTIPKQR